MGFPKALLPSRRFPHRSPARAAPPRTRATLYSNRAARAPRHGTSYGGSPCALSPSPVSIPGSSHNQGPSRRVRSASPNSFRPAGINGSSPAAGSGTRVLCNCPPCGSATARPLGGCTGSVGASIGSVSDATRSSFRLAKSLNPPGSGVGSRTLPSGATVPGGASTRKKGVWKTSPPAEESVVPARAVRCAARTRPQRGISPQAWPGRARAAETWPRIPRWVQRS